MRAAIARREIHVHFQPEFDLTSYRIVRFEALARWNHPRLGPIPPAGSASRILPESPSTSRRCSSCATIFRHGGPHCAHGRSRPGAVSGGGDGIDRDARLRGAFGAPAGIEGLGITLALDDFGTGYSSLSYLSRLSFDAVKIDGAFVNGIEDGAQTRGMLRSLVGLAHNLGMRVVVVDGVETPAQLRAVAEWGADDVQGFLLGVPERCPKSRSPATTPMTLSPVSTGLAGSLRPWPAPMPFPLFHGPTLVIPLFQLLTKSPSQALTGVPKNSKNIFRVFSTTYQTKRP